MKTAEGLRGNGRRPSAVARKNDDLESDGPMLKLVALQVWCSLVQCGQGW